MLKRTGSAGCVPGSYRVFLHVRIRGSGTDPVGGFPHAPIVKIKAQII